MTDNGKRQTLVREAEDKIAAAYRSLLKEFRRSAWDIKVPTQKVLDGLTTRIEVSVADLVSDLNEQTTKERERLDTLGEAVTAYLEEFGIKPEQLGDDHPRPKMVSWATFREALEDKERDNG